MKKLVKSRELNCLSSVEFAALSLVHGTGHNASAHDENNGHHKGIMNDLKGFINIFANLRRKGFERVFDKKDNSIYRKQMERRFGTLYSKDNYEKNKNKFSFFKKRLGKFKGKKAYETWKAAGRQEGYKIGDESNANTD